MVVILVSACVLLILLLCLAVTINRKINDVLARLPRSKKCENRCRCLSCHNEGAT